MPKIIVRLPAERDYAGLLELQGPGGRVLAGPFDVCARADDTVARNNRNPDRNPLLPFGDVPLGVYRVVQLLESGSGTPYPAEEFGSAGIVLLQAQSGDAVLADANGRFGFFIQGGRLTRKGALRPTEGSLRLADRDLRSLLSALRKLGSIDCECVAIRLANLRRKVLIAPSSAPAPAPEVPSPAPAALEPLAAEISRKIPPVTRRSWLRTVILSGASVTVPGALVFTAQAAAAQTGPDYSPTTPPQPGPVDNPPPNPTDNPPPEQPNTNTPPENGPINPTNPPPDINPNAINPTNPPPDVNPNAINPTNPPPEVNPNAINPTTPPPDANPPEAPANPNTTPAPADQTPAGPGPTDSGPGNTPPDQPSAPPEQPAQPATPPENPNPPEQPSGPTETPPPAEQPGPQQPQPIQVENDLRDAPNSPPSQPGTGSGPGQLTPFPGQTPPQNLPPDTQPPGGTNTNPMTQLGGASHDEKPAPTAPTNEMSSTDAGIGFDKPSSGAPPVTSTVTVPSGTPVVPDAVTRYVQSHPDDPDAQVLVQYQQQKARDQAAAAAAAAEYQNLVKTNPNANMSKMLDAQAKVQGDQGMINMATSKVTAKLPPAP